MGYHLREFDGQLDLDLTTRPPKKGAADDRRRRGMVANLSGAMAEDAVATLYQAAGYQVLARRWRGQAGEIDLICQLGDCTVFVEVKSAGTHLQAAERLQRRQMDRICLAACEYSADLSAGLASEMRFDAALVDLLGRVEIIENAFGEA